MMNMKTFGFTSALLLSAMTAFATEGDSLVTEQKSLLQKLDSINDAVLGLKLNGSARAGVTVSNATSDQFAEKSPTQENQAYTDVNLVLTARPSSETKVHIEMRLHKDWQTAYDENNNPIIGHWFSYDGSILDKHLDFNLGYMRVGYTPVTLYTPQAELLQEPEIFAEKRILALSQRNLDTTSRRLLQGVNADYHSGTIGFMDDIHMQATGARMRNTAKKKDQLFFDFDFSDRYMLGSRLGFDAFGAHIGANYVDVFDRRKSTYSRDISTSDTLIFEDNMVYSAEFGFNSSKLLTDLPVVFGFNGEFAKSNLDADKSYLGAVRKVVYNLKDGEITNPDGSSDSIIYVQKAYNSYPGYITEDLSEHHGYSIYVAPYVKGAFSDLELDLNAMYLQNDRLFWSELASSPANRSHSVIFNSNALYAHSYDSSLVSDFGMSSLENLYFSVYNSTTLNATNMLSSLGTGMVLSKNDESEYMYSRLYNNYKNAHYYRNGYSAEVMKRSEAAEAMLNYLDPTVSLALPYGIATPDRKGFKVALDLNWNDAATLNARFSQFEEHSVDNNYTQYAAGLGVNIGRLIGLDREITLQGSYDHAEEDAFLKRSTDRIIAGATIDVWGPVALLAGYQTSTKEFGNQLRISDFALISKTEEALLLVGPRVKIAPMSYLSLQYGTLNDKIAYSAGKKQEDGSLKYKDHELSIDKTVIVGEVTVNF